MWRFLILYLAGLTLRSFVFAAVAALATLGMRSVARRHAVWVAVLGCLLLAPLADFLLPASFIPARAPEIVLPVQTFVAVQSVAAVEHPAFSPASIPPPSSRDWWQIAAFIWMGIAAALLLRLAAACFAVVRIRRACRSVSQEFGFTRPGIRESGQVTIPLTVGLWNPVLILPLGWRDWDNWKLRAVLTHELAHVRRRDWAIALTATLTRCVFWFNPLSWWLERHLSSLAEQASDEACVQATGDAPRYAETLLQFASVAKHGRRWIGGVAMAQYKISSRIERILRLQKAGSGVLSRAGWLAVCVLAIPVLYVSAAAQSRTRTEMPMLSPAEILRMVQPQVPAPESIAIAAIPAPQLPAPVAPAAPAPPQAPAPATVPAPAPAPQTPFGNVAPVNPDLVGEIKLILAPVDRALPGTTPGQVQIQTRSGPFAGTAVWNVRNNALDPNTWAANTNWRTYSFAMTGVQGRTVFFETIQGGTFSYGCRDCSFLASDSGVRGLSASNDPGIAFHLNADGTSVTATCRAAECRIHTLVNLNANFDDTIRILKDSQSLSLPVPKQPVVPGGVPVGTLSAIFFSVTP